MSRWGSSTLGVQSDMLPQTSDDNFAPGAPISVGVAISPFRRVTTWPTMAGSAVVVTCVSSSNLPVYLYTAPETPHVTIAWQPSPPVASCRLVQAAQWRSIPMAAGGMAASRRSQVLPDSRDSAWRLL